MGSVWRPDDSELKRDEKGVLDGVRRVRDALRKNGVRFGNRVITSQDKGMQAAQRDLKRTGGPSGVEQWIVPIVICPKEDEILFFLSVMEPGAKVPEHSHDQASFRIIVAGSVSHAGIELKPGDWIHVPAQVPYALEAGPSGCTAYYGHPTPHCSDLTEDE